LEDAGAYFFSGFVANVAVVIKQGGVKNDLVFFLSLASAARMSGALRAMPGGIVAGLGFKRWYEWNVTGLFAEEAKEIWWFRSKRPSEQNLDFQRFLGGIEENADRLHVWNLLVCRFGAWDDTLVTIAFNWFLPCAVLALVANESTRHSGSIGFNVVMFALCVVAEDKNYERLDITWQ
jgi:hypothetical protein